MQGIYMSKGLIWKCSGMTPSSLPRLARQPALKVIRKCSSFALRCCSNPAGQRAPFRNCYNGHAWSLTALGIIGGQILGPIENLLKAPPLKPPLYRSNRIPRRVREASIGHQLCGKAGTSRTPNDENNKATVLRDTIDRFALVPHIDCNVSAWQGCTLSTCFILT